MSQQGMEQVDSSKELTVTEEAGLREELGWSDPSGALTAEPDPRVEEQADKFVAQLLAFNPQEASQVDQREANVAAVENLGARIQTEAAKRSGMLREPIAKLAARGEDGGEVAKSLIDLKMTVEDLDPGELDLEPGWFSRTLGFIPGVGKPLKRYFTRFESSQTVIDAIIRSLKGGKETLGRDNTILAQDQKAMRQLTLQLQQTIQLGLLIDRKISYALEREIEPDDPRRTFIEEELLYPLRQRIQDLQQQLAVNQQGVIAIEIIRRNNKELIKGVDRALKVTVNALNVAVTVALALANQKIVLNKIQEVNAVTNHLITQTSANLRTQAAAIHKQSSESMISMDTLKQSFADINATLEDISTFRQKALPSMANSILELDQLTKNTEQVIKKLEKGSETSPSIELEIESL